MTIRFICSKIFIVAGIWSSAIYPHTFINNTPENFQLHVDIVAGFDAHEQLPKGETLVVKAGMHPTRGIKLMAAIGNRPQQTILEHRSFIVGNHVYKVFCAPVVQRKEIPGGHAEQITAYKFYLVREVPFLMRLFAKSGVVAESDTITVHDNND